jgi:hypothetical protein
MKLYHFAPTYLLEGIQKNGLTKGTFPVIRKYGPMRLLGPCQWMTNDMDFNNQSWATTRELIDYDRNDVRLMISIPKSSRIRLVRACDFIKGFPEDSRHIVTDWPGSEHWYLYLGNIPSGWIREIVLKEDEP